MISVLSIDGRMLTSETAALVGLLVQTVSELPVAMLDADGVNLPLRGPLGARGSSDMVGLSLTDRRELTRTHIETFTDTMFILVTGLTTRLWRSPESRTKTLNHMNSNEPLISFRKPGNYAILIQRGRLPGY